MFLSIEIIRQWVESQVIVVIVGRSNGSQVCLVMRNLFPWSGLGAMLVSDAQIETLHYVKATVDESFHFSRKFFLRPYIKLLFSLFISGNIIHRVRLSARCHPRRNDGAFLQIAAEHRRRKEIERLCCLLSRV